MTKYLDFFTTAIQRQSALVGQDRAFEQARRAGITLSASGRVTTYAGDPCALMVRLIRVFSENTNYAALEACAPILQRLKQEIADEERRVKPSPPTSLTPA